MVLLLSLASLPAPAALDAATADAANVADARPLTLDETIVRSHGADQRFRYVVEIDDDGRIVVEVEQRGLNLVLSVTDPTGSVQTVNSPLQRDEREVLVIGGSPGTYTIEIYSTEYTGAVGGHAITAFRPTPEPGTDPLSPYQDVMRGNALNFANEPAKRQEALAAYLAAANAWADPGHEPERAWALFSAAGMLYWRMLLWQDAAAQAQQAADLYRDAGAGALDAAALHLEAASIMEIAGQTEPAPDLGARRVPGRDFEQAETLLNKALETQIGLGLSYDAAKTTNNLGLLAYYKGDWNNAESFWSDAAERFHALKEWSDEQNSLANLGVLLLERGQLSQSVVIFSRSLEILEIEYQPRLIADTLDNRATALSALGQYDAALRDHFAALRIHRVLNNIKGQGRSLSGIAMAYGDLGEPVLAQENYESSLRLREQSNDVRGVAATLILLGNLCRQLEDMDCAFDSHRQAVAIAPGNTFLARAETALAVDYLEAEKIRESLAHLESAIAAARRQGAPRILAEALVERARISLTEGNQEKVWLDLDEAQTLFERMGMTEKTGETMYLAGRSYAAQGDLAKAVALTRKSIEHIELVRERLTTPALRATYLGQSRAAYELQIDLLMSATKTAAPGSADDLVRQALDTAERSRGRMLLDLLDEAELDLDESTSPILTARHQALTEAMTGLAYRRDRLLQEVNVNQSELKTISAKMDQAATELRILEIEIREADPRYAAIAAPRILDSHAVQRLLPENTALLIYHVGEATGFLWVVTRTDLKWKALPGRAVIDQLARSAYELLQDYPADMAARSQRDEVLARLSDLLLGVELEVADKKRLIIVPDGALHYVPFAALPLTAPGSSARYLLSDYEIQRIPSASALAIDDGETWDRTKSRSVAIFADPIFHGQDPRMEEPANDPASRQNWIADLDRLQRLEWSAEEAEIIAALADPEQSLVLTGPDATREAVLATDLSSYRYLHFATHSFIDTQYPSLSGLLLSGNRDGGPADGLLQLDQISSLSLNAELAVLSACETALGREIRGEGLVGLTQGFILAGARHVVASLWRVPDRGTAELMALLYRNLMVRRLPVAAALRGAQLELSSQRRWADPYYWGGFILQTASASR